MKTVRELYKELGDILEKYPDTASKPIAYDDGEEFIAIIIDYTDGDFGLALKREEN